MLVLNSLSKVVAPLAAGRVCDSNTVARGRYKDGPFVWKPLPVL